ncbi:MAG: DUF92 domain-containing protein [Chloroflexota bacterium]
MVTSLLIGFISSIIIAFLAYSRKSLSQSGVIGTIIVGTAIFGFGGSAWWVLLIAFFVSASALSHVKKAEKAEVEAEFSKGSQRDIGQVFANGGLAALIAVVYGFLPSPWLWAAFAGTMGTVNADTWATELGILSKKAPRLITNGQIVAAGTSGGITTFGTLAALAGAVFIGLIGASLTIAEGISQAIILLLAATIGGLGGALFDSLLGATVQQIYLCDRCNKETERTIHHCGQATRPLRGWAWMNNDAVNFISSIAGATLAVMVWLIL